MSLQGSITHLQLLLQCKDSERLTSADRESLIEVLKALDGGRMPRIDLGIYAVEGWERRESPLHRDGYTTEVWLRGDGGRVQIKIPRTAADVMKAFVGHLVFQVDEWRQTDKERIEELERRVAELEARR